MNALLPLLPFTARACSVHPGEVHAGEQGGVSVRELRPAKNLGARAGQVRELPRTAPCKRILLVDDDEQVLTSVAQVMESEGYVAILAANGCEAVAQCRRYRPDLIVVDLNMPLKDGWATLEAIEEVRPFLPMIVITGKPLQFERALAFGVDALMEKPLDLPVLLAAIGKFLTEPAYARLSRITNKNFSTIKLSSVREREP